MKPPITPVNHSLYPKQASRTINLAMQPPILLSFDQHRNYLTAAHDARLLVLNAALQHGIGVDVTIALIRVLLLVLVLRLLRMLSRRKLLFLRDYTLGVGGKELRAVAIFNISLELRSRDGILSRRHRVDLPLLGGGSGEGRSLGRSRHAVGARRLRFLGIHRPGNGSALVPSSAQSTTLLRTSDVGVGNLKSLLVDSELDGSSGSLGTEIVHASLETELPTGEVHGGDLAHRRILHVNVEGLRLIDEGTTVSSHLDDGTLRELPDGLVERLDVIRDVGNLLDGAVGSNDAVLHLVRPQTEVDQVLQEPGVDDLELTGQDTARVNVRSVRLEALVEAKNLTGRGSRHGRNEQGVADTVLGDLSLQAVPVPQVSGGLVPHVILQNALGSGATLERLIGAVLLGELNGGSKSSVVDGLEDLNVEVLGLRRIEGHTKSQESIGETVDTNSNGAMAHVAPPSLRHGVVVDVDDLVQVLDEHLSDIMKLLEVINSLLDIDKGRKCQGCKVADSDLIRGSVLDNLAAEVGAADGAKVLLVALAVAVVLVQHEGVASLDLSLKNGVPELLGTNGLTTPTLLLVLLVQSLELVAVDVGKTRALVGAHQSPGAVLFDTLHEEIGDPQSVKQVASANLFLSVVLAEVKEAEDIGMPRLEVNGECTGTLVATLVDIAGGVVVHTEHRNEAVAGTVGASNIAASSANTVDIEADTTGGLGNHGAGLQGIVDTLNAVLLHVDEEAGSQLRLGSTGVEESCRVC